MYSLYYEILKSSANSTNRNMKGQTELAKQKKDCLCCRSPVRKGNKRDDNCLLGRYIGSPHPSPPLQTVPLQTRAARNLHRHDFYSPLASGQAKPFFIPPLYLRRT